MNATILLVDDYPDILETLPRLFQLKDYRVLIAQNSSQAMDILSRESPDVIISDYSMPPMPEGSGLELLRYCKQNFPDIPFILITGQGTPGLDEKAEELGAYNYITKPFDAPKILKTISNALDTRDLKSTQAEYKNLMLREIRQNLIYESKEMGEVANLLGKLALTDASPILILGETGTGKDVLAKTLHNLSDRKAQPFLEINCTALQANLLENELFGHEKGSFTDAREQKKGLFEIASEGTLFLDEIGDMDLAIQAKLLRVLESRRFMRIGGTQPIQTNARVVAATNKDLRKAVEDKSFRADLFYRLNLVSLIIPPLRSRKEDIIPLVRFFLETFNRKFKKNFVRIDPDAEKVLLLYQWAGNVRELRNMVERIVLLENDDALKLHHLPPEFFDYLSQGEARPTAEPGHPTTSSFLPADNASMPTLRDLEKAYILKVLEHTDQNRTKTASILGINRKTLWEKLKEWGYED
jgi:DNA-binding NtrC family response regulator